MSLPQFKLLRPRSVEEAVDFLARHSAHVDTASVGAGASPVQTAARVARTLLSAQSAPIRIIAGGTDLIPSMRQKLFEPEYVLDLRGIAAMRGIKPLPEGGVEIGALTTLRAIERSDFLRQHYPVLTEAAATVASPVLRNMGTIGGNICLDTRCLWYNQSLTWRKGCGFCIKKDGDLCHVAPGGTKCWAAFSGDTPPALLCLNAEIEIAGPGGARRLPLRDFYTGLGEDYRRLQPNELVTRIFLPASSADYRGIYRKLRVRGSIDYPLAGVAVVVKMQRSHGHMKNDHMKNDHIKDAHMTGGHVTDGHVEDARVGITAVNPAPLLVKGVGELLAGKIVDETLAEAVGDLAARTAKPLTTSALTPEYRREMIRVFTKRAVLACARD